MCIQRRRYEMMEMPTKTSHSPSRSQKMLQQQPSNLDNEAKWLQLCVKKHDSLHSPLNILVEHSHTCMEDGKPSNPACPTFQDPWIQNLPPSDLFIQTCCTPAKEKGYWNQMQSRYGSKMLTWTLLQNHLLSLFAHFFSFAEGSAAAFRFVGFPIPLFLVPRFLTIIYNSTCNSSPRVVNSLLLHNTEPN